MYWEDSLKPGATCPFCSLLYFFIIPSDHITAHWSSYPIQLSFSGSSPRPTPGSLLIFSYPWAEEGSSPHGGTCQRYSLTKRQQTVSFLTAFAFSSSSLLVQLLSAAEAWMPQAAAWLPCQPHPFPPQTPKTLLKQQQVS